MGGDIDVDVGVGLAELRILSSLSADSPASLPPDKNPN